MRVNAGALDRRLEIQTATSSQDALGQANSAFTPGVTVYAQRLDMRTQDAARAGQRDSFALARFLIRYRTDLTTAMRVRDGTRLYDIKAIDELPDRRTALVLTVEEVRT